MTGTSGSRRVDFGARQVDADEHPSLVRGVFDSVASRYDLMNDLMSGGLHRLWKQALIDRLNPRPGTALVDIAGGTGDVAERFLRRAGETASTIICDLNANMLLQGRDRLLDGGRIDGISLICCNAETLPLGDRVADACTISFGLRNVTRRTPALREAWRVLKPGGHFLCLEFSPSVLPILAPLYDAYSGKVLPALGQMVTGDRAAYQYLVDSIRKFPPPEMLAGEMAEGGFENINWRALSGGIVAIHSGWRI